MLVYKTILIYTSINYRIMIKFFRKIRQKLIKEGQMKSYLIYAIGEILLVMVGILLALQVNNWNNQRKDDQLAQQYLMSLKEDAQNNIKALEGYIQRAENYVQKVADFQHRKGANLSKVDLDSIGINRQTYFLNMDTYQEIISNGHLKLLPNEVKVALGDMNSFFKLVNKIDNQNTGLFNNQHLKMADYFELKRLNRTSTYKSISNPYVNAEQALLTYKNYINLCYDWMKTQQYFYSELKKNQLALIELLEN